MCSQTYEYRVYIWIAAVGPRDRVDERLQEERIPPQRSFARLFGGNVFQPVTGTCRLDCAQHDSIEW